jgi:DNA-binding transcriptional LysR family regulator
MERTSAWILVKVVEAGSFSEASRRLKIPVSTISTRISQLERELGVALLQRTTRRLRLTEPGELYFRHASRAVAELQEAEESLASSREEVRGRIRVTSPVEMGSGALSEAVAGFLQTNPRTEIELLLTDRVIDLVAEGVDLAIRVGKLEDSSLVARRLGASRSRLFASPAYLRRNGVPREPRDLSAHVCLGFMAPTGNGTWVLDKAKARAEIPVRFACTANNLSAIHQVALAGLGIALLPLFLCSADLDRGALVPVLEDWGAEEVPVHLLHPKSRFVPVKTRALIDHLVANLHVVF